MAKLVFVCILALLAFQQSCASPINVPESKEAWDVFQYIDFLFSKIEYGIKRVTTDLPEDIKTLSDQINTILSHYNLESVIIKAKEDIKELSQSQKHKLCVNNAELQVNKMVENVLKDQTSCEEKLQSTVDKVEEEFKSVAESGREVANLLNATIEFCNENPDPTVERCLDVQVFDVVDRYIEFDEQIERVLDLARTVLDNAIFEFNKCVGKLNNQVINGENLIINNFKKCLKM